MSSLPPSVETQMKAVSVLFSKHWGLKEALFASFFYSVNSYELSHPLFVLLVAS